MMLDICYFKANLVCSAPDAFSNVVTIYLSVHLDYYKNRTSENKANWLADVVVPLLCLIIKDIFLIVANMFIIDIVVYVVTSSILTFVGTVSHRDS